MVGISKEEFLLEESLLNKTLVWIKNEINESKQKNDNLKDKVATLSKAAKGGYNEELEISKKLLALSNKKLTDYNEALNAPYFGRINFREYKGEDEIIYIGKTGLSNPEKGEELVVDWRAPIADLYYSGTAGETYYKAPIGVINGVLSLKRRFLIKDAILKDAFDEGINEIMLRASGEENVLVDEFLKLNLEESVSSKLKDVVATIQKEQNDIIRLSKNDIVIVQGGAGSGKTTVALHRLAYLIYRYADKLKGENILVIAPNKLFLDYISEILPNLGVDKVSQNTFEELAFRTLKIKGKVYSKDKKLSEILESDDSQKIKYITNSAKLKGSIAFKNLMDRYIKIIERKDSNVDDIKIDQYTLFDKNEVKRLYTNDLSKFPLNKRKEEIKRYLALKLSEKITKILEKINFSYEYMTTRIKNSMEDSKERRVKLIEIYDERDAKKEDIRKRAVVCFNKYFDDWGNINTADLYYKFFNDDEIYNEATSGIVPSKLRQYILDRLNEDREKGIIDSDDLNAILYLYIKINEIPQSLSYEHIVVDEVQDYSEISLAILKEFSKSLTLVGDIGQGIYFYRGINDWDKAIELVFNNEASYKPLLQSYRSTVEVIEVANAILKKQNNNLELSRPVLRHGEKPKFIKYNGLGREFGIKVDEIVNNVHAMNKKRVAIIGKTQKECKKIKDLLKKYSSFEWTLIKDTDSSIDNDTLVIPSYMTKGLEFDCTIVYDCNKDTYSDSELDKKLLYVVLTRALHLEYIFYSKEPSTLIEEFIE